MLALKHTVRSFSPPLLLQGGHISPYHRPHITTHPPPLLLASAPPLPLLIIIKYAPVHKVNRAKTTNTWKAGVGWRGQLPPPLGCGLMMSPGTHPNPRRRRRPGSASPSSLSVSPLQLRSSVGAPHLPPPTHPHAHDTDSAQAQVLRPPDHGRHCPTGSFYI